MYLIDNVQTLDINISLTQLSLNDINVLINEFYIEKIYIYSTSENQKIYIYTGWSVCKHALIANSSFFRVI